jgi:hypothetical protein
MKYTLSRHARQEMQRRKISQEMVEQVLTRPQQIIPQEPGKKIYQSQLDCGDGKIFLVRVVVADEISPPVVVTVYRTKKISKYWRLP